MFLEETGAGVRDEVVEYGAVCTSNALNLSADFALYFSCNCDGDIIPPL